MSIADVERAIESALAFTTAAVEPVARPAADIVHPLSELATGGKRLRARLLLAAHAAYGGPHPDAAAHVAAAIELFQTAALVHDDVLDQADTRRGSATIHRQLEASHIKGEWEADAGHFGVAGAILAGDIALMASQLTLSRATAFLSPPWGTRVAELFAHMSQLCTAGQYADMRLAAQPVDALPHQEAEIIAMMRSKTASYTAEFPLALGAASAEAGGDAVSAMRDVGVPLGIAFQLRDDVLGLVGHPDVTGKPAGDDIREGKRTLVMVHAWREADSASRARIGAAFSQRHAEGDAVAAAVEVIAATGAIRAVEQRIIEFAAEAREALEAATPGLRDASALAQLHELLDATTHRVA
jgi:geranylgeranyl diphosphate synthase type I